MKVCSQCGDEKELTEFHKNSRSVDGRNAMCKKCKNKKAREYYYKKKLRELNKDSTSEEFTKEFGDVYNSSDSLTSSVCDNDCEETDNNLNKYESKFERLYVFVYNKVVKFANKIKYILFNN